MSCTTRGWILLSLGLLGGAAVALTLAGPPERSAAGGAGRGFTRDSSLDIILGNAGRERHAAALAQRNLGGKKNSWKQYAAWGKELLINGCVKNPPTGGATSRLLADTYRCVHCHNLQREDTILAKQDPAARELALRKLAQADPSKRDGTTVGMTPATTLWGAVNRQSFYNGYYKRYHDLRLANGQRMDPTKLKDAVQICCSYCSGGRFAESWELDSMIACLWEQELRLRDLNYAPAVEKQILSNLNSGNANAVAKARAALGQAYLRAATATIAPDPVRSRGSFDLYAGGVTVGGDAKAGKFLYLSACAGCHGSNVHRAEGARLVRDFKKYSHIVLHGTERDGLYMPLFTAERLSRKQLVDIRIYLSSLRGNE